MRVSARTWLFVAGALCLSLGSYAIATMGIVEGTTLLAISDLGEPLVISVCALMALWVAASFDRGESLRRQWYLIGLGLLFFALGDVVWAAYDLALSVSPPSPGLIDICYVLFYLLAGAGILGAALGYRRLVSLLRPALGACAVGILLGATMWTGFLEQVAAGYASDPVGTVLSILYPLADVAFVIMPTTLVLLVALKMRGARLAIPWIPVALGGFVFAVSDTWYLYLQWAGQYQGGHPLDLGWMVGAVLIGVGASLAADINLVGPRERRKAAETATGTAGPAPAAPTA